MTIATGGRPDTELRRSRTWRLLLVPAVVAALVVALVAASRYQPIGTTGYMGATNLTADEDTFNFKDAGPPTIHVDDHDDEGGLTEYLIGPYPDGGRFGFLASIGNDGPTDIQIQSVHPAVPSDWSDGSRLFVRDESVTDDQVLIPVDEPFTLRSHGTAEIGVAVDVRDCAEFWRGRYAIDEVVLDYQILGITRTAHIPLEFLVTLDGLPDCRAS